MTIDNNTQAVDIKGYRVLSDEEKAAINKLKQLEAEVLNTFEDLNNFPPVNKRSIAIAKTELQTCFMWAIRAIARPNGE